MTATQPRRPVLATAPWACALSLALTAGLAQAKVFCGSVNDVCTLGSDCGASCRTLTNCTTPFANCPGKAPTLTGRCVNKGNNKATYCECEKARPADCGGGGKPPVQE